MTNRTRTKKERRPAPARRSRSVAPIAAAAVAVVGLAALAVVFVAGDDAPSRPTGDGTSYVKTGEINEMGMPVIVTPGSASGTAAAAGVTVEGATWQMGTVPLLAAVRPTWELVNNSAEPVTLGEPHAEIREGCCPGPLTLGSRELAPGASTTLTFELSMHPGMDGWHDIAVHVPVLAGASEGSLELVVTGDFRGELG